MTNIPLAAETAMREIKAGRFEIRYGVKTDDAGNVEIYLSLGPGAFVLAVSDGTAERLRNDGTAEGISLSLHDLADFLSKFADNPQTTLVA